MGLVRGWASGDTPTHRAFPCQPNLIQSALFNAISINQIGFYPKYQLAKLIINKKHEKHWKYRVQCDND